MNDLQTITATALIGTERQALSALTLEPNLSGATKESALLSAAALVSTYQRAGHVAPQSTQALETSPVDTKPELTAAMDNLLHRLLAHGNDELLEEYLGLLAGKGVRFKHRDLPLMLENARTNTAQRALIAPLLDARGRWLASQNKTWLWATGSTESIEDAVQTFETGSKSARVLALRAVRERDPERARALLETTWKQDAAPERKEFIAVLETNLSDADEAFFETALATDRSGDVRDTAADLLAKLPNSAFNARMRERLRPILRVTKPKAKNLLEKVKDGVQEALGNSNARLEIELPESFDPEWAKDGIQEKAPQGYGQKQFWVQQLMQRATLPMLEEITGMDAITLLKNTHKDWKSFVQNAVMNALNEHAKPDLVKRIIAYDITMLRNDNAYRALEPEFLESLARQRCFTASNNDATLLNACGHTWNEPFRAEALEWIASQLERLRAGTLNQYFSSFGDAVQRSVPLEAIGHVLNGHPSTPRWNAILEHLNDPVDEKQKNRWYWEYAQRETRNLLLNLRYRLEIHETMR